MSLKRLGTGVGIRGTGVVAGLGLTVPDPVVGTVATVGVVGPAGVTVVVVGVVVTAAAAAAGVSSVLADDSILKKHGVH